MRQFARYHRHAAENVLPPPIANHWTFCVDVQRVCPDYLQLPVLRHLPVTRIVAPCKGAVVTTQFSAAVACFECELANHRTYPAAWITGFQSPELPRHSRDGCLHACNILHAESCACSEPKSKPSVRFRKAGCSYPITLAMSTSS